MTFLDAIVQALRSATANNSNDTVAPLALFWTDETREWEAVIPRLREKVPVLTLGPYDLSTLTGPAIWIRCMLARKLAEANWGQEVTPIVYLPGYSRASLRVVEECPEAFKPLAGLQYLSVYWSQKNGRDWTLPAFLQSQAGGLGINVASDFQTAAALRRAAAALLDQRLEHLKAHAPLQADFFNELLTPDLARQVLLWMNAPDEQKAKLSREQWGAFCAQCRRELGLDPERDGELTAARRLGEQTGRWAQIWSRFAEAPANYPALPDLLRRAKPKSQPREENLLISEVYFNGAWPQDNESQEADLRAALLRVAKLAPQDAARELARLEETHSYRREWVWAKLDAAPLAFALEHLMNVAQAVATPPGKTTTVDMATWYAEKGWKADLAALQALAAVRTNDDKEAVAAALAAIYVPWLRDLSQRFQTAWEEDTPQLTKGNEEPQRGGVFLFVDGLRMDVAHALKDKFQDEGFSCELTFRLAPLPSVTETAKPAAAPVAASLYSGPELAPATKTGAQANAEVLRKLLEEAGYAVLRPDEVGDPEGAAWTECGRLDEIGHMEGWRLAARADEELQGILRRVRDLLDAGWQQVRIVTDHGWLLVLGGLPVHRLPEPATEIRKGRAARLKPGATVDCMTVPWFWDSSIRIAVAPGISCFIAGKEYEHGGISPQEVVVPALSVRTAAVASAVYFEHCKWAGLRCKVRLGGAVQGLVADIRTKAADPSSSLTEAPKPVEKDGSVSLLCPDDGAEGRAAVVVVFAPDRPNRVLAQQPTVIGSGGVDGW